MSIDTEQVQKSTKRGRDFARAMEGTKGKPLNDYSEECAIMILNDLCNHIDALLAERNPNE